MFKKIMAEVAAPRRGRYLQNNTTINPWGRGYVINDLLILSDTRARMTSRRMMSSFPPSSFVTSTTTTATDNVETPTKDGSKEGKRTGQRGRWTLQRPCHGGRWRWLLLLLIIIINFHQCHSTINKLLSQQ